MPSDKHSPESFDLADSPGHLLHRAQQFAAERFTKAMAGAKLTQRQFAVLHATSGNEGLTQTELVKTTGIDRSTLAELVSRMARNGLLEREKLADDARANAIHLSAAGRALLEAATLGAMDADRAIISALPKNKRANFLETLRRIALTLEKGEEAVLKAKVKDKEKKKKAKKRAKDRARDKARIKAKKAGKKARKQAAEAVTA